MAEDEGFELINEQLRPAVAGGAHPRRIEIGSNPHFRQKKITPKGVERSYLDE